MGKIPSEVQSVSVTGQGADHLVSWWIEPSCQADIELIVNHTIGSLIPRRLVQLAGCSGGVLFRILVLGSCRITTVSPSTGTTRHDWIWGFQIISSKNSQLTARSSAILRWTVLLRYPVSTLLQSDRGGPQADC